MKTIEAYKCDFCQYQGYYRFEVEDHEFNCIYNPVNKHCYTCGHFKSIDADYPSEAIEEARKVIPNLKDYESVGCYGGIEYIWFNLTYCRQMETAPSSNDREPFYKCKKNCKLWIPEEKDIVEIYLKEMKELKSQLKFGDEFTPAPQDSIKISNE